jgi:hypothetical protein
MTVFTFPKRRKAARGEDPYPPAGSVTEALAALEEQLQPSFTPASPRPTGPIPALADAQLTLMRELSTDPGTQPQPADYDILRRVLQGLRDLDKPDRARKFADDRKTLPLFSGTAKRVGWCGLHASQAAPEFRRMSADRWYAEQMARIGHATEVAQAEIRARATLVNGIEKRIRGEADAGHVLGGATVMGGMK